MNNPLTLNPWAELNEPAEVFQKLGDLLAQMTTLKYREVYELLLDMLNDCALAYRWDTTSGFPVAVWYAHNPGPYADRIFPIEDDVAAALLELFLEGYLAFSIRTVPTLDVLWRKTEGGANANEHYVIKRGKC